MTCAPHTLPCPECGTPAEVQDISTVMDTADGYARAVIRCWDGCGYSHAFIYQPKKASDHECFASALSAL